MDVCSSTFQSGTTLPFPPFSLVSFGFPSLCVCVCMCLRACVRVPHPGRLSLSIEHPLVYVCLFLNIHPVNKRRATEGERTVNLQVMHWNLHDVRLVVCFLPERFVSHNTHCLEHQSAIVVTDHRREIEYDLLSLSLELVYTHRTRACTYNSQTSKSMKIDAYETYN